MSKLAVLFLSVSALCFAEDYSIRLERPAKVGDTYQVVINVSHENSMQLLADGKPAKQAEDKYQLHLTGVHEVLEVGKDARPTRVAVQVEECYKKAGNVLEYLAKKGDRLTATRGEGETEVQVNGKDAAGDTLKNLRKLVSIHKEGRPSDDQIFGTTGKVKVGESWNLNTAIAAADLAEEGVKVAPDKVSGSVQLQEIVDCGGEKCQKILGTMKIQDAVIDLPAGFKMKESQMTAEFGGLFPAGSLDQHKTTTANVFMKYVAEASIEQDGKQVNLDMTIQVRENQTEDWKKL